MPRSMLFLRWVVSHFSQANIGIHGVDAKNVAEVFWGLCWYTCSYLITNTTNTYYMYILYI